MPAPEGWARWGTLSTAGGVAPPPPLMPHASVGAVGGAGGAGWRAAGTGQKGRNAATCSGLLTAWPCSAARMRGVAPNSPRWHGSAPPLRRAAASSKLSRVHASIKANDPPNADDDALAGSAGEGTKPSSTLGIIDTVLSGAESVTVPCCGSALENAPTRFTQCGTGFMLHSSNADGVVSRNKGPGWLRSGPQGSR